MGQTRQITEKELKIAAKEANLQPGVVDLLIAKVRERQRKITKEQDLYEKIENLGEGDHEGLSIYQSTNESPKGKTFRVYDSEKYCYQIAKTEYLNSAKVEYIYEDNSEIFSSFIECSIDNALKSINK